MASDDLAAFLRAQWDADEQMALNWQRHHHALTDQFMNDPRRKHVRPRREPVTDAQIAEYAYKDRFDPARVLRDVEAKRRILDEYTSAAEWADTLRRQGDSSGASEATERHAGSILMVLRLLALPYADVDSYREEWKP